MSDEQRLSIFEDDDTTSSEEEPTQVLPRVSSERPAHAAESSDEAAPTPSEDDTPDSDGTTTMDAPKDPPKPAPSRA
ncbi:MAG: hypothetical protein ACRDPH_09755, partial [Marmoricola sp.]